MGFPGKERAMATSKPIAVGILGYGRAGHGMQAEELKERKEKFRITAVCDILEERRAAAQAAHGCKTYARYEEMLADPDVELITIATRSCDHYEHARKALLARKIVFVEKPMTSTLAEARRLRALAARHHDALFVRHNRRFEPLFQHVREIIASGLLGDVFEIKLRRHSFQRRDDWQTLLRFGGGQLLNWGPHIIDHALQFLQTPPVSLWSDLKRVAAVGDAEDHIKIVLRNAQGLVVDLEISGGTAISEPQYLVCGNRGALTASGNQIRLRYLDPKRRLPPRKVNPGTPEGGFGSPETLPWIEQEFDAAPKAKAGMTLIWDFLYDTIRKGVPFPITLDEAVAVMEVIHQARKGTPFEI
jgi:predicted dehydrogenase